MEDFEILDASGFLVGVKQSTKAMHENRVIKLYIAKDVEQHVIRSLIKLAREKEIEIVYINSMLELGRLCNIDVGAATAVIVK